MKDTIQEEWKRVGVQPQPKGPVQGKQICAHGIAVAFWKPCLDPKEEIWLLGVSGLPAPLPRRIRREKRFCLDISVELLMTVEPYLYLWM